MSEGAIYSCCDERRRAAVKKHSTLNGIDFLEVIDHGFAAEGIDESLRQCVLRVHLINPPILALENAITNGELEVRIDGGVRVRDIVVKSVELKTVSAVVLLEVLVDKPGDFSTYTLKLVGQNDKLFPGLDPLLSSVDFSFKVECGDDFDCGPRRALEEASREAPEIDYLAKDYGSFRRLMLERMALTLPWWQERNVADIGVTLVELLAYVGDHLSYEQDALATEAYLHTAHRRVSIRRHARLVDYVMHEGCNARVWLQILLAEGASSLVLPAGTRVYTAVPGIPERVTGENERKLLAEGALCFETMERVTLHPEHEDLKLYTWGQRECCLPKGATRATLVGAWENLKSGTVLIFEEVKGPRTGRREDADPNRRHAVRLTRDALITTDPLGGRFLDPPSDDELAITEIKWHDADALPFSLCISAIADEEHGRLYLEDISVARGNIVLADHGLTIEDEELEPVPDPDPRLTPPNCGACGRCESCEKTQPLPRFRPCLAKAPLTWAATITRFEDGERTTLGSDDTESASAAMQWEMQRVLPAISLEAENWTWLPQRDLLSSDEFSRDFVVEIEDEGRAALRFGDDRNGAFPASGTRFRARYRIGNGTAGNVGAESLKHVAWSDDRIRGARNPLPARGGVDPESIEQVRQNAPFAFRVPERAVAPEDYAAMAERHLEVQRAVATLRWTGSWRTVFLTVDRMGGRPVNTDFETELRAHLERYRMAGQDIEIDGPRFVPLELELKICVMPDHFRSDVKGALREVFAKVDVPGRGRGFFHPDNFTFAQPVYTSHIYAAAQAVAGVRSVEILKLQRLGNDDRTAIDEGALEIGRLEIARLDNDPSFPEWGVVRFRMEGGR